MATTLPLKQGDVVDRKYRVEKILGVGGMGAVVGARHVELGTKVALKFLLPALAQNPNIVRRFQREARAAVLLKGDHTARVLDVGKLPDGAPYLVMEFLDGRDLGQVVADEGALPIADAASYLLQACESIAEAHGVGIVHRDLKPQNMFLTRRVDGTALVKVLDFGLAGTVGAEADEVRLTSTTDVMGSPAYMSPEQLKRSRDAGVPSDIWSLGVCLFELLTGQLPFDATSVAELSAKVLMAAPTPVHTRRADVPPGLETVIFRCLQKDPRARFPDVAALAAALEPFAGREMQGAGRRVASTLETARRAAPSEPPRPPDPGAATDATAKALSDSTDRQAATSLSVRMNDTKTAFDSDPRKEGGYAGAVAIGVAVALLLAGAGLVVWLSSHGAETRSVASASSSAAPPTLAASAPALAAPSAELASPPSTGDPPPSPSSAPPIGAEVRRPPPAMRTPNPRPIGPSASASGPRTSAPTVDPKAGRESM